MASYSVRQNQNEPSTGCADEPVHIATAAPAIETSPHSLHDALPNSFKDKAKISGLFGAHPGGQIGWKLYDNKSCSAAEGGLVASEGPVAIGSAHVCTTAQHGSPTQACTCN